MTINIDPQNIQEGLIIFYIIGMVIAAVLFAIAYPSLKERSKKSSK